MFRYYAILILSISITVVSIGYLCFIFVEKWKKGKRYQIRLKETVSAFLGLLIFGFFFVLYVQDLPDVLSHHPTKYEGKCEVEIISGKGAHLEANFGEHYIRFDNFDYSHVQQGNYYCKVEYYPHSEEGYSLKLYQSKGGKVVEVK
ncbi:hypothetical protein KW850_27470 [Bacillus sp. sid0103]|uniref:hypothetical protein n=1 Tax=Bacillus sp. sid0103 TaxID=2856337 RepID=UPI001C43D9DA|nr:hypothetical protein [Bacillus sp. sid0103]MBV7508947.1 hypothetical protein [Bacillus sp. sid0103]